MPAFARRIAEEMDRKKQRFGRSFDTAARDASEQVLQDRVEAIWSPLPGGAASPRPAYAVDGASAMRHFHNGASLLVCQSLLAGPDVEDLRVEVEVVRGGEVDDPERAVDRLRQFCELRLAADCLPRLSGGILLVDGSLAGTIRHVCIARPGDLGELEDLRGQMLDACLRLFEGCGTHGTLLVGVSKTAGVSLLSGALRDAGAAGAGVCDAEMLSRFTDGTGYTAPLLVGREALQGARLPEGAGPDGRLWSERVNALPAIAVFYVRLSPGDDVLRVDVLGSGIGLGDRLDSLRVGWAPPESVEDVVRLLADQFGGPSVYNVPLYTVDKAVRLSEGTVSEAYVHLLREMTGATIRLDRGSRRFM